MVWLKTYDVITSVNEVICLFVSRIMRKL